MGRAPGNVVLTVGESGLDKTSVVNVSQLMTLDRDFLTEQVKTLAVEVLEKVEAGLRLALAL